MHASITGRACLQSVHAQWHGGQQRAGTLRHGAGEPPVASLEAFVHACGSGGGSPVASASAVAAAGAAASAAAAAAGGGASGAAAAASVAATSGLFTGP